MFGAGGTASDDGDSHTAVLRGDTAVVHGTGP
jgi:hypothetical protein